jgi:hypothetical protein
MPTRSSASGRTATAMVATRSTRPKAGSDEASGCPKQVTTGGPDGSAGRGRQRTGHGSRVTPRPWRWVRPTLEPGVNTAPTVEVQVARGGRLRPADFSSRRLAG